MVNTTLLKITAAIERDDGTVAAETDHPRKSHTDHTLPTPCTPLDPAYFTPAGRVVALTSRDPQATHQHRSSTTNCTGCLHACFSRR